MLEIYGNGILACVMSLVDVSLTYYTVFLEKKKIQNYGGGELNLWAKYLMIKNKLHPASFLVALLIPQIILFLLLFVFHLYDYVYAFIGAFTVVIMIHIANLKNVKKNWDNKAFWVFIEDKFIVCSKCGGKIDEQDL